MTVALSVGFIPLVDCAPLAVAEELGFAAEEGLELRLVRAPSWSSLRDMLAFGRVEAAHVLAPVPVAGALGLGGATPALAAVSVLSVNGNTIGASRALADRLRGAGSPDDFADAAGVGHALAALEGPLRIGVPFPFSMHAELLYYWLNAVGIAAPQAVEIRTVPPPLMAEAMRAGEIDAFCVGEPWGSVAVDSGVAELILPGRAIWSFAPEKVLATRADWAAAEPEPLGRLLRAVWRAGRWLDEPGNLTMAAEILARPAYVDVAAEIVDRALTGRLVVTGRHAERRVPGFLEFHRGAASYPWRSQAAWIGARLAARTGLDRAAAMAAARSVFRTDLYRAMLEGTEADLPGASDKLEGALPRRTPAASERGRLYLAENRFFDGRVFDPIPQN